MSKLAKIILLSALGVNFLFVTGIAIFTEVKFSDKWVLFLYISTALMALWLYTGKTRPDRNSNNG